MPIFRLMSHDSHQQLVNYITPLIASRVDTLPRQPLHRRRLVTEKSTTWRLDDDLRSVSAPRTPNYSQHHCVSPLQLVSSKTSPVSVICHLYVSSFHGQWTQCSKFHFSYRQMQARRFHGHGWSCTCTRDFQDPGGEWQGQHDCGIALTATAAEWVYQWLFHFVMDGVGAIHWVSWLVGWF